MTGIDVLCGLFVATQFATLCWLALDRLNGEIERQTRLRYRNAGRTK